MGDLERSLNYIKKVFSPLKISADDYIISEIARREEDIKHSEYIAADRTANWITVVMVAFFAILLSICPIIFIKIYKIIKNFPYSIDPGFLSALLRGHAEMHFAFLFIFAFSVIYIFYFGTLLFPENPVIKRAELMKDEATKSRLARHKKISIYVVIPAILVNISILFTYLYAYAWIPVSILDYIIIIFSNIVVDALLLLGIFFVNTGIWVVILALIIKIRRIRERQEDIDIIKHLVGLLEAIPPYPFNRVPDKYLLYEKEKKRLFIGFIFEISEKMRKIYKNIAREDGISYWSVRQMELAADNFLALAKLIYYPREDSLKKLRKKLIEYLNMFLTGNYDKLPREKIEEIEELRKNVVRKNAFEKLKNSVSLVAHLLLPIGGYFLLINLVTIEIPDLVQSFLVYLYFIWLAYVLIKFSKQIDPEAKSLIETLVRTFVPKGK